MKKKKTSVRLSQKFPFIIIALGVVALFIFAGVSSTRTSVLGASTTNSQQWGFSFSNFFSFLFGLFSAKNTTLSSGNINSASSFTITPTDTTQIALSNDQLLAMAGDIYANGTLPLGDNKYTTSSPKQGYVYFCNVPPTGGGAEHAGSWLGTTTWNSSAKPTVEGSVSWPNAQFSNTVSGNTRTITGNGLPVGMTTGTFPISSSDPASQYDRNPNSITTQTINLSLPANPTYSDTPYCMGMEVGVMTNGVSLFNGFDADLRDAAAHEIQDSCDGHPESTGQYHYHSLSRCFTDISISTVIGFALDGFPITGPVVSNGKYLTTQNLDECHGITSTINLDGKEITMYHYVMTYDFPYSVSCFRGKPVSLQIVSRQPHQQGRSSSSSQGRQNRQSGQQRGNGGTPPQGAISACVGQTRGTSCSFTGQNGSTITGTCQTPPNQTSEVCVPANRL